MKITVGHKVVSMPEPDRIPCAVLSLKLRLLKAKVNDFRVEGSLRSPDPARVDLPDT